MLIGIDKSVSWFDYNEVQFCPYAVVLLKWRYDVPERWYFNIIALNKKMNCRIKCGRKGRKFGAPFCKIDLGFAVAPLI